MWYDRNVYYQLSFCAEEGQWLPNISKAQCHSKLVVTYTSSFVEYIHVYIIHCIVYFTILHEYNNSQKTSLSHNILYFTIALYSMHYYFTIQYSYLTIILHSIRHKYTSQYNYVTNRIYRSHYFTIHYISYYTTQYYTTHCSYVTIRLYIIRQYFTIQYTSLFHYTVYFAITLQYTSLYTTQYSTLYSTYVTIIGYTVQLRNYCTVHIQCSSLLHYIVQLLNSYTICSLPHCYSFI